MSDRDDIEDEAININEELISPALQVASDIINATFDMMNKYISCYYLRTKESSQKFPSSATDTVVLITCITHHVCCDCLANPAKK